MKKIIILVLVVLLLSILLTAQEPTGEEIIDKVNDILTTDTSHATMKMTIITSSGNERTFVYETWSKNRGEKNLIRYLEPRRVKDQATLMLNHSDDIWMFFPRTQRVRKLASHAKKQKMEGSDFSYEDLGSGDTFIDDFTSTRLDDEEMEGYDCYKLELIRNPKSDVSYSRLIIWVIKENYVPVVIDYYSENDPQRLEKRLEQSDIQMIDGIPTAKKVVMHNENDNTKTELELVDIEYNIELEDSMFTERSLKK